MFNPKWVTGRKIVRVDLNPFFSGRPEDSRAYDPVITLDNGAQIKFLVQETDVGEYGVEFIYIRRPRK